MRYFFTTLARCWILIKAQNPKESSDVDSDEGPLRKYRRLTIDHWTAASYTMDRLKKENKRDIFRDGLRTRDVGVLCTEKTPVNDKCIMVGTTGIAALKAEYGDDFTNVEIIQDVGYSSESSTHLSGDDAGTDHAFNIQIFQYSKDNQPLNLRQELEAVAGFRGFQNMSSSLESSSSATASLNDSGLGAGERVTGDPDNVVNQFDVQDELDQEDLDLQTVLDDHVDFGANTVSEPEELHFNISGIESDDQLDDFHKKSSFTTSAQLFYKMISVDSDNGEVENSFNENNVSNRTITETSENGHALNSTAENNNKIKNSKDSDTETSKPAQNLDSADDCSKHDEKSFHNMCSTPIKKPDSEYFTNHPQGLKRKRDYDNMEATRMSNHVRSWLKRCSSFESPTRQRRPATRVTSVSQRQQRFSSNYVSSCDASCECTSSSADEGNVYSPTSSFLEEDSFVQNAQIATGDAEESVETIISALLDQDFTFLPPPPSSSASCMSDSKNCSSSTICYSTGQGKVTKSVSETDVRKQRNIKKATDVSSHDSFQNDNHPTKPCHRVYSSLPNVLCHLSESSTDDNFVPSVQVSQSDTPKSTRYANRSSSSEAGRRRRRSRKKSSSSNRSSTSVLINCGNPTRHKSRNSSSRLDHRTRPKSQHSDFYCAEDVFSDEESCGLKVEIPSEENNERCAVLLSPVESDIVLTHLEEQSTVSDQVWDGYQEMPYLSEGYSEATVDEDAVRKLTEFGDDYTSAIGQPPRLLVPADKNCMTDNSKSPKKSFKSASFGQRRSSVSQDSDSDSENLHYVIEDSDKALQKSRSCLEKGLSADCWSSADQAELLATCGTHLSCLLTICELINDEKENNFSPTDLTKLYNLIEEWQELQKITKMHEKTDDQAEEKYKKALENIDELYCRMSEISSCVHLDVGSLIKWEDIEKNLERLQMVLTSLQETKEQLLAVNLQVHRFTTEYGSEDRFKDSTLKSDITELYRKWDDIYEQNGNHLTELHSLKAEWKLYNTEFESLRARVLEFQSNSDDACDNNCLMSAEDLRNLRRDFELLEDKSAALRNRFQGGEAWVHIDQDLQELKREINVHDILSTAFLRANHQSSSTIVEKDADGHFVDAEQQLHTDSTGSCKLRTSQKTTKTGTAVPKAEPKKSRSRLWRIVRMAIPVHVALVLLYCLACYMEPSCCNMLNNFNFSLTPKLRYFGGGPPV